MNFYLKKYAFVVSMSKNRFSHDLAHKATYLSIITGLVSHSLMISSATI